MRNQQIKIFIVIIIAFSFPYVGFSQSTAKAIVKEHNIKFVNNKIKFRVIWASKRSKENGLQVGYDDRLILDLTDNQLQKIESLRCDELLILLKDDKTDWATNLILYYIHEESAALFYPDYDDTKEKWLRFSKDNDIKFWTEKFAEYRD